MRIRSIRSVALLALGLCLCLGACGDAELELRDAWLAEPPPGAMATAAYGTLVNGRSAPLTLVGFASDACETVELHRTVTSGDVVRMERIVALELAAGESLRLEPGGAHLMLMRPRPLAAGESARLTVEADDGSRHAFELPVRRRDSAGD